MHRRPVFRVLVALAAVLAMLLATTAGAAAQEDTQAQTFSADLQPVPHEETEDGGSSTQGEATLSLDGNQLTVSVEVQGAAPNLPHAQHLHGMLEAGFVASCPGPEAQDDQQADGLISTPEGVPDYGMVQVSLTTEGDTGPDSVLAVPRYPVADGTGSYTYERTFEVSDEVANKLGDMAVVVHGIDINGNGEYDMDAAGASPLDPSLPFEATIPAACGAIQAAEDGMVGFTDVPADAFFADAVQTLAQAGIIEGFPNNTFRPAEPVTRAQAVTFIGRTIAEEMPPTPDQQPFPDVPTDVFYAPWVELLAGMGIVEGTAEGTFQPDEQVTRGELATFVGRALLDEMPPAPDQQPFPDVPTDAFFAPWVAELAERGIITGYPDGTFRPSQEVTRGEAATIINRAFQAGGMNQS